jgi:hypothetical protein
MGSLAARDRVRDNCGKARHYSRRRARRARRETGRTTSGRPGGLASGIGRPAPGLPGRRWPRLAPGITAGTACAVMAAPGQEAATRPGAGTAVTTGRPARVQVLVILGKSHRYSCSKGDLNTETNEISPDRGSSSFDGTCPCRQRHKHLQPCHARTVRWVPVSEPLTSGEPRQGDVRGSVMSGHSPPARTAAAARTDHG